jgi:hypothetical protein
MKPNLLFDPGFIGNIAKLPQKPELDADILFCYKRKAYD